MKSATGRLLIAGTVILLVALGGWYWYSAEQKRAEAARAAAGNGIPVELATATRADVPVFVEGLGTVQAFYTVTITARVDGQLQRVAFTEGQQVKKGSLLAQIDPRPYQAALDQALATGTKDAAQLANARLDLKRYEELAPDELASKQTVDTQRALVAQLDAQVKVDAAAAESARTQLDYTSITAPISGRTGIRLVDPGNNVHAGDTTGIVVVTQVQPITTIFSLPEDALAQVTAAMARGPVEAIAVSRDHNEELERGVVALVDNQIDQTTGTVRLKATFENAQNKLWPGQFINVRVLTDVVKQALTIPFSAVQRGPNGAFAYVVQQDSTVEAAPLKLGQQNQSVIVVEQGLEPGAQVVTSNQYRLQPKSLIKQAQAVAKQGDAKQGNGP